MAAKVTVPDRLQRCPLLYRWLPVLAWMGFIFFLSAQPHLPNPAHGWLAEALSLGAHATVFGVLAVLWQRALGRQPHAWLMALGLTLLYALSDEFHQAFVPGRHPDPWDLLCDGLGAGLGLVLWSKWQRH